jgi:hypothetical protein
MIGQTKTVTIAIGIRLAFFPHLAAYILKAVGQLLVDVFAESGGGGS